MGYYKIVSYILLVIAGFFALVDLYSLLVALSNPNLLITLLITVFLLTSVIIYSFTSFSFFTNGIQKERQCKPNLKDWIKVNAYVSIAFGLLTLFQCGIILFSPTAQTEMIAQFNSMNEKTQTQTISNQSFLHLIKGMLFWFMVYGVLLLSHVFITLRLIKEKSNLFGEKTPLV